MSTEQKLALQKMIIGHYIEDIPEECTKKVCYVLQGDGVWEVRSNEIGDFTTKVADCDVPGLISDMEEGWELAVPLIPTEILMRIISFFRRINNLYSSEVFVQVFWDKSKQEYFDHCPPQNVSGTSVKYKNDEHMKDPNKILVLEIHSHNKMGAFFSATDDADEKGDRFFGVIGKIDQTFPEMKLRLSVGGRKVDASLGDIFDIDDEKNYPKEWIDRVDKNSPTNVYSSIYSSIYTHSRNYYSSVGKTTPIAACVRKFRSGRVEVHGGKKDPDTITTYHHNGKFQDYRQLPEHYRKGLPPIENRPDEKEPDIITEEEIKKLMDLDADFDFMESSHSRSTEQHSESSDNKDDDDIYDPRNWRDWSF